MDVIRILATLACAAATAAAQHPVVGEINLYGLHKVPAAQVLEAAGLKTGAALPASKGDMEDRVSEIPGVTLARIEAVCCQGNEAAVFVGIEERGAPHTAFRSAPAGVATLPQALVDRYHGYLTAVDRAAIGGGASEDLTAGHSIMSDAAARKMQEEFVRYAAANTNLLRIVLREAAEPEQRAIAAAVIGYAPDKQAVAGDLQYALTDPAEDVRANALRSLKAFAVLAAKSPDKKIDLAPAWLVELLHSVVLTDRTGAVDVLVALTDRDNQAVLDLVRQRALSDLAEMARWPTLSYALPPFLLLGRTAGLSDAATRQNWVEGRSLANTP